MNGCLPEKKEKKMKKKKDDDEEDGEEAAQGKKDRFMLVSGKLFASRPSLDYSLFVIPLLAMHIININLSGFQYKAMRLTALFVPSAICCAIRDEKGREREFIGKQKSSRCKGRAKEIGSLSHCTPFLVTLFESVSLSESSV